MRVHVCGALGQADLVAAKDKAKESAYMGETAGPPVWVEELDPRSGEEQHTHMNTHMNTHTHEHTHT